MQIFADLFSDQEAKFCTDARDLREQKEKDNFGEG